jgi:hypothetical protein
LFVDEALEKLLQNPGLGRAKLWRGQSTAPDWQGLSSGYPGLDRHLPGGGWPQHALTEILLEHYGAGELKLLMPALARLSQPNDQHDPESAGWLVWVAPPFQPYPPALVQWGIDLSRVLIVRPRESSEVLWAAEQALSSGNCAAVLLWSDTLSNASSRRLQLAAEKGRSWAIAFRPLSALSESSAAALRVRLSASLQGMELSILKNRGGRPAVVRNVIRDYAG